MALRTVSAGSAGCITFILNNENSLEIKLEDSHDSRKKYFIPDVSLTAVGTMLSILRSYIFKDVRHPQNEMVFHSAAGGNAYVTGMKNTFLRIIANDNGLTAYVCDMTSEVKTGPSKGYPTLEDTVIYSLEIRDWDINYLYEIFRKWTILINEVIYK